MAKVEKIEEASDIYMTGSICLSNIPQGSIYVASNGKQYANIIVKKMRQANVFNEKVTTHEVLFSVGQAAKQKGEYDISLGKLTEWKRDDDPKEEHKKTTAPKKPKVEDDLPW